MRGVISLLSVTMLCASGCAQLSNVPDPPAITLRTVDEAWCAANSLVRLSDAEINAAPRVVLIETIAHNEKGIKICGWGD
jgi:hypothetical protein